MFTNIIQNFLNYLINFALILRNITFVICSIASSPNKINVKLDLKCFISSNLEIIDNVHFLTRNKNRF